MPQVIFGNSPHVWRALAGTAVALGVGAAAIFAAPAVLAGPGKSADLRADVNRDGAVDVTGATDDGGEDVWRRARGAIVLPNLDDDTKRCPVKNAKGKPLSTAELVRCNDASDTKVNGVRDAADLAPLRTVAMPGLSASARGSLALTGKGARYGRLFLDQGAKGWRPLRPTDRLTAAQLRRGVRLGLEATDLVRDPRRWNGTFTVRLAVTDGGKTTRDTVVARVAPLLTHHHLQRAERVLVTSMAGDEPGRQFRNALATHVREAGIKAPLFKFTRYRDPWTQDFFEPGYVSMPGPGGRTQSIRVMLRSAQLDRDSGRELWERLRGPDIGAVQVPGMKRNEEWTLSSMGNLETIPPYRHDGVDYPAGRIVMGHRPDTKTAPAKAMRDFLKAQGMQRPLLLDTSWLSVGHVDEFLQFLPADTPRGWRLAVSDPDAGLELLRGLKAQGHGKEKLFSVPDRGEPHPPKVTINEALENRELLEANALASRKIALSVATLQRQTGLTDAEIVRIPGLYDYDRWETAGSNALPKRLRTMAQQALLRKDGLGDIRAMPKAAPKAMSAYIPGAINGVLLAPNRVLAARQWGPVIGGKDVFAEAVTAAYGKVGVQTVYIDDWYTYHLGMGEVHCGTNTLRSTAAPWW